MSKGDADAKDESEETVPNPFSQLTDQELEEYKKEVERKKREQEQEGKPVCPIAAGPASLEGELRILTGVCRPCEDLLAPSPNSTISKT